MNFKNNCTIRFLCAALVLQTVLHVSLAVGATIEERVTKAAKAAVCKRSGFSPSNVEITMHSMRSLDRYAEATGVTVTIPDYDDAIGPVTGRAVFTKDGEELGSIPVPMRVSVYGDVLVTAQRVKRHTEIRPSDVAVERMDITRLVGRTIAEPDSLVGQWLTRTMSPGQIIDRKWVEAIPIVRRGDRMTMEYSANNVQVSANVTAMEDGYLNETIAVKTDYANRLVQAVVVDGSTVHPIR